MSFFLILVMQMVSSLGKIVTSLDLQCLRSCKINWCGISLYFTGLALGKISSKHMLRLWTEADLQRNPAHTRLHIKKASYLIVIPVQGGVMNKLSFPPICSFRWRVYAQACICCSSLGLGSFGGGQWEYWYGEGGKSEDNCFLLTICLE